MALRTRLDACHIHGYWYPYVFHENFDVHRICLSLSTHFNDTTHITRPNITPSPINLHPHNPCLFIPNLCSTSIHPLPTIHIRGHVGRLLIFSLGTFSYQVIISVISWPYLRSISCRYTVTYLLNNLPFVAWCIVNHQHSSLLQLQS